MRLRRIAVLAALLTLAASGSASAASRTLTTGFFDNVYLDESAAIRSEWFDRTRDVGAGIVRITLHWSRVAPPARPSGFRAADPNDPAYRWGVVDAAVQEATSRGLAVLLTIQSAPPWAEGAGRAKDAPRGTWRPDAGHFGDFARAAALRYSQSVSRWQIWNEPNLTTYLAPQWVRTRAGFRRESPRVYRSLLNAGYDAIKRVSRRNLVVAAGTAPYGDPFPGGRRLAPIDFLRTLFCFPSPRLKAGRCPVKPRLDVVSHHPYAVAGPRRKALNADDAAIPDVVKVVRVVRAAERQRTVFPARRKRIWATELSWDSSPPDPQGVPEATHARWLSEAFYLLWRQGVDTLTWFQIRDAPPQPGYSSSYQSGVFIRDGTAKAAAQAFRFPFVALKGRAVVRIWGRAPATGGLRVEQLRAGAWRVVRRLPATRGRIFSAGLRGRARGTYRAVVGGEESRAFPVR